MVSDYIDRELGSPDARALEHHLTSCVSCPPLYAGLVAALAELKVMGYLVTSVDDLVRKVTDAVNAIGISGGDRG